MSIVKKNPHIDCNKLKLFSFLICLLLIFSCSKKDVITGNWQINSIDGKKSDEYIELFIDEKQAYVFNEVSLIYVWKYKIENKSFVSIDGVTKNNQQIELYVENEELNFDFIDSINIKFKKIKTGILPEIVIEDIDLEDCYYISFFDRQESYLEKSDDSVSDSN